MVQNKTNFLDSKKVIVTSKMSEITGSLSCIKSIYEYSIKLNKEIKLFAILIAYISCVLLNKISREVWSILPFSFISLFFFLEKRAQTIYQTLSGILLDFR